MKKILSILAAFSISLSSASMVIACGISAPAPTTPDSKKEFALVQAEFDPFPANTTAQKITETFKTANFIQDDQDDIKVETIIKSKTLAKTTISITDSSIYNNFLAIIDMQIDKEQEAQSINNLTWEFNPTDVDLLLANPTPIIDQIQEKIKLIDANAKLNVDYEIIGLTSTIPAILNQRGLIVRAKTGNKLIKGEFLVRTFKNLKDTLKDWQTVGTYDESKEVKKNLLAKIAEYLENPVVDENGDYVLEEQKDNSWTIKSMSVNSRLRINFTFYTHKESIVGLKENFTNVIVGDDFNELKSDIKTVVDQLVTGTSEEDDYTIIGDTSIGGKDITVRAKPTSQRLVGAFTIPVKKFEIQNISIADLKVLTTDLEVSEKLISSIQNLNANLTDLTRGIDFSVTKKDEQTFVVESLTKSNFLMGTTTIRLNKYELNEVRDFVDLTGLTGASTETEVRQKLDDGLNKLFIINGQQRLTADQAGQIQLNPPSNDAAQLNWEAKTVESNYLEGTYEMLISKIDLSQVINVSTLTVGEKQLDNVIDDTIQQVNEVLNSATIRKSDYIIEDSTEGMTHTGKIKIIATEQSHLITGSVTINVTGVNVTDLKLFNQIINLDNPILKDLDSIIINKINTLFKQKDLNITINKNDYEIYDFLGTKIDWSANKKAGVFTLKASPESNKIIGEFDFPIGPIHLEQLQPSEPIIVEDNKQVAVNKVIEKIESLVENFHIYKDVDYKIIDNTKTSLVQEDELGIATQSGTIVLQAIDKDELGQPIISNLVNSYAITVRTKTINKLTFTDKKMYLNEKATFNDLVKAKIQSEFNSIVVQKSDFEVLNSEGNSIVGASKAGTYKVKATNGSRIINGEFNFEVLPNDISSVGEQFNDDKWSWIDKNVEETVTLALREFMGNINLTRGDDFEFYDLNDNVIKDLQTYIGIVVVKAINADYIVNSFEFRKGKFQLDKVELNDHDIILANEANPDRFKTIITDKIKEESNSDVILGIDFTISDWKTAFEKGEIVVEATNDSKLVENSFVIKIKPVSLSQINFGTIYDFGTEMNNEEILDNAQPKPTLKRQEIEKTIDNEINQLFTNSWVAKNNPNFALKLNQDYQIQGLNDNSLLTSGANAIIAEASLNSRLISDRVGISVTSKDTTNTTIYSAAKNNYLLTSSMSVWGPVGIDWTNPATASEWILETTGTQTNPAENPIKADEILGVTNSFLVTTRGIFYTNKLIEETKNWNLTLNDVLLINDESVITTKGSWYIQNFDSVTKWDDYPLYTPTKIAGLDDLNRTDFLGVSKNLIVTTQGVWTRNEKFDPSLNSKVASWEKVNNNDSFDNLTLNDVLAINDQFFVTNKGVWIKASVGNLGLTTVIMQDIEPSSIQQLTNTYIQIKDLGTISYNGTVTDWKANENTVITKTNNYLVTGAAIYWQGEQIATFSSTNTVYAANDDWLLTSKGVYYHNKLSARNSEFGALSSSRIRGLTSSFLVLNNKVQFKDYQGSKGNLEWWLSNDMNGAGRNHQVRSLGKSHLAINERYVYFVSNYDLTDSGRGGTWGGGSWWGGYNWWIPGDPGNRSYIFYDTTTAGMNDYYLTMKGSYHTNYFDGPNARETGFSLGNIWYLNKMHGRFLFMNNRIYYNGIAYTGSENTANFQFADLIGISDDRIITTKGIYYRQKTPINKYQ